MTSLGLTGLNNGATTTINNYLQFTYAVAGSTSGSTMSSTPGLFAPSTLDLFANQINLDNGIFGKNWISTSALSSNWQSISLSCSGQYQTACIYNSNIYVSSDYGKTWSSKATTQNWTSVSISASGQYQTATYSPTGQTSNIVRIYYSSDYGQTWTQITTPSSSTNNFVSVSVSSSGQYQSVCAYLTSGSGDYIYISSDYGKTWNLSLFQTIGLISISVSGSGQYQIACSQGTGTNGYIYISTNYGQTWIQKASSSKWISVSLSGSGQYQTACINSGLMYISSDYGQTWSQTASSQSWKSVSLSSSGHYQVACIQTGYIYISSDYGKTWSQTGTSAAWNGVSISGSGQYISGCISNGLIYICTNSISNGVVSVGNYSTTAGPTAYGATGSIYYDTTLTTLQISNGITWTTISTSLNNFKGVTANVNYASGWTSGATYTSDNYLIMGAATGPDSGSLYYPGIITTGNQGFTGNKFFGGGVTFGSTAFFNKYTYFNSNMYLNAGATFGSSSYFVGGATFGSSSYFVGGATFGSNVCIGDAGTDLLLVNAGATFNSSSYFVGGATFGSNVCIGDAGTDSLLVNAGATFTSNVCIGNASSDSLLVNAGATFTSFLSGTTGTFIYTVTANAFNSTSDYRIKDNVRDLSLEKYNTKKLRPVQYYNKKINKEDIGFIAHEVQEEIPFLVTGEKDGEQIQSLNYSGLIGILVKEVQDLKERIKILEENNNIKN